MKILFDHQIFTMHKIGGVSRYFCELIKGIDMQTDISCFNSLKYTDNEYMLSYSKDSNKGINRFPTYNDGSSEKFVG